MGHDAKFIAQPKKGGPLRTAFETSDFGTRSLAWFIQLEG